MHKQIQKFGYFSLILFFVLVSVHFWTAEKLFYYYKEVFAVIFFVLSIPFFNKNPFFYLRAELFFLVLFFMCLVLSSIFIPSRELYLGNESIIKLDINPNLYVIRNALLYIPMLIYIYNRGLTVKETNLLLQVISIFGVISIIAFLVFYEITPTLESAIILFSLGGDHLQYNSFVPYLTFPFSVSVYLVISQPRRIKKILFFIISIVIFSYIVITTSRQSIIFCILVLLIFTSLDRKIFKSFLKTIISLLILSFLFLPAYLSNIEISEKFISKITSIEGLASDETSRLDTAVDGLSRLSFIELMIGAGVSSVINSGPHNDFVRWTQRIGIIGALTGFLPFLISFIGSLKLMRKKYSIYHALVFIGIFFTIYISFFGYPREDAYQAPFVWLGLSLWLIINKQTVNKK